MASALVNAWIFLSEDNPSGTSYSDSGSCYQSLIQNNVYSYLDSISITWVNTVAVTDGYSIELQTHTHPDGSTNLQYLQWVIADARAINPNINIFVMMGYGGHEISQIFSGPQSGWQAQAEQYAANIVAYLQQYDLNGLDIDWEEQFVNDTTQQQFQLAFTAIGQAFAQESPPLILTMSPASIGNLDPDTINTYFRYICPQYYSGLGAQNLIDSGVSPNIIGYGVSFETSGGYVGETAQSAYQEFLGATYPSITMWRLNSGDFQYEQAQVMVLSQLVKGAPWPYFNDTPIVAAAGNPPMHQITVRSGDILNAIQASYSTMMYGNLLIYQLVQHGGNSGDSATITLETGETIVRMSGTTGLWFKNEVVLQVTFKTSLGNTYGPYGTWTADNQRIFYFEAPSGQSIVSFNGTTLGVPLLGGDRTVVIGSLGVTYG